MGVTDVGDLLVGPEIQAQLGIGETQADKEKTVRRDTLALQGQLDTLGTQDPLVVEVQEVHREVMGTLDILGTLVLMVRRGETVM